MEVYCIIETGKGPVVKNSMFNNPVHWPQGFETLASFNIQYTYMKVVACFYDTHIYFSDLI